MGDLFAHLFNTSPLPSKNTARAWLYAAKPGLTQFQSTDWTGKWCVFRPADEIDAAWALIQSACEEKKLLVAKVSTSGSVRSGGFNGHVICVYNEDYRDKAEVEQMREVLRELGFKEELGYKRDIDTKNGVYGEKEWWMRSK